MADLSFIRLSLTPHFQTTKLTTTHSSIASKSNLKISSQKLPARDITIDFGKHKGKMLGTLPSNYLQWVSNNLRARDFEQWAKLADEVLFDPVYRDRIEWEFAEKVLTGTGSYRGDSVSELLEISERFGWDNEDKKGWKDVDFGLLGTSKGGRIPRVSVKENVDEKKNVEKRVESGFEESEKRRERRERVKKRRESTSFDASGTGGSDERRVDSDTVRNRVSSPFPGREGLLKKVLNRERLI